MLATEPRGLAMLHMSSPTGLHHQPVDMRLLGSGCGKQGLRGTSEFTAMEKSSIAEQRCDLNEVGFSNNVALPGPRIYYITISHACSEVLWHSSP